ncbi:MAG: helix-turn-helix transcriptional regulator [Candidatus Acidiferrales bacterium]
MAHAASPGDQLRELRNRLGITTREVEEFSRRLAENSGNEEFYISNAWLTQLENRDSVPSIYKLFSLSVIYRSRFVDLLAIFGIDLGDSAKYQLEVPLANTHLAAFETLDPEAAVTFPIRLDRSFSLEKTSLVSRVVEVWGEVPVSLIQMLDVRHTQYGYIGMCDFMMYPLLRPGTFVQIDSELASIQPSAWRTEFDRPIYFIELRDSYACSWCELSGSQLTLLPHPLSACSTRQFAYPDEAEIVGQVTAVAMRLVSGPGPVPAGAPRLPKRS